MLNLPAFPRKNHSKHRKWKKSKHLKIEFGNPEYSQIQTYPGDICIMLNWLYQSSPLIVVHYVTQLYKP